MTNKEISKLLREIAASYVIKNEAKYRFQIIAYRNAADSIDGLSAQLQDLLNEDNFDEIPGIGKTINERLHELLISGKVNHFEEVKKGIPESTFILMDIPSFGPKKAYKLAKHFELNNTKTAINELEKHAKKGEIAPLEGFGKKSEEDIIRAIDEYKKGVGKTTKLLLPEATDIAEDIIEYLKKNKKVIKAEPLGSLRRKKPLVGDIDIAVATNHFQDVIDHFIKYPRSQRIIEKGEITSSLLTTSGAQVDLMVQPPEAFGALLQHFTGSKAHNVHLREIAIKKGLSLSEKGIKNIKSKKMVSYSTELDFYKALGLPLIPPELREDTGEIELAIKNNLPVLIEKKDIKGEFHLHSSFPIEPSHDLGLNNIEEMIIKAKELKYQYIGFSEHNPSQSKHNALQITDLIKKRNEEIEIQTQKHKFHTFKMMETDILPDGSLALPESALNELDATIVSIHSVFNTPKSEMTKRIINGLSHPKAIILAHPTGRLLNERNGYDIDFDELFDFCKKYNKILEINAYPNRLDLEGSLVKSAINSGIKLVIGSDAHRSAQMELIDYGIFQARRGFANKNEIINSLSYNKIKSIFNK